MLISPTHFISQSPFWLLAKALSLSLVLVPATPTVLLAAVASIQASVPVRSWLKKEMAGVGLEMHNRMIMQLVP